MITKEQVLEDALRRAEAIAAISLAGTRFSRVLLVLADHLYIVPMPEKLTNQDGIRGVTNARIDYVVYIEQEGEEVFVHVGSGDCVETRIADVEAENGRWHLSAWREPDDGGPAARIIAGVFT